MYAFAIGLLLVAFQVSCDGAPGRLIVEPIPHADVSAEVSQEIPVDVSQEKPPEVSQEKHLEKRAGKSPPQ